MLQKPWVQRICFQQQESSLESYYNPHIYLLRGQGLLWYMVLTRAQIHTNVLYICSKLNYLHDHQELSARAMQGARCNYLTIMTTSSLPMAGLIIGSLVMLSMRSESTLFPTKLAIAHQVHLKSNVSMSCCATSGIHLQGLFTTTLAILC